MLTELWHFYSEKIKKEILAICVWDESSKLRLRQWLNILELETYTNDAGGISYGSLGACDMWRTDLGENGIHFGWHHVERKSYEGKTILERGSDPRRYHRIVPLGKCHYNFSVPLFCLQCSSILRRMKKLFHSIVCCIRLRVCTQDFYYNRLGLKPTSWFVHPQYTSLFLACVNQFPRVKWAQFPLTSYFLPWRFTIWHAQPPYDHSFSFATDHLKPSNSNSSSKKISLTSLANSEAVVHKSWVARCFLSTPRVSCNNLHKFRGFNQSLPLYSPQVFLTPCCTIKFLILQTNYFKFPCILPCIYEFRAIKVLPHYPHLNLDIVEENLSCLALHKEILALPHSHTNLLPLPPID